MSSIKIDGNKIRALREQKELTQLYVATVVEVTTDTISRWENKKYSAIKPENAAKLAETLGVELEAILEEEEPVEVEAHEESVSDSEQSTPPPEPIPAQKSPNKKSWRLWLWIAAIALALIVLALVLFFLPGTKTPTVEAVRTLPGHTAPNVAFPVIIRLEADSPVEVPILLREEINGDAIALGIEPKKEQQFQHRPRWIGHLNEGRAAFLYMVRPSATLKPGESLLFSGDCVAGSEQKREGVVRGEDQVVIELYHWADEDKNYSITDNEILDAYEQFTFPGGPQVDFSEVELLWLAGKYRWDEKLLGFVPVYEKGDQEGEM